MVYDATKGYIEYKGSNDLICLLGLLCPPNYECLNSICIPIQLQANVTNSINYLSIIERATGILMWTSNARVFFQSFLFFVFFVEDMWAYQFHYNISYT